MNLVSAGKASKFFPEIKRQLSSAIVGRIAEKTANTQN